MVLKLSPADLLFIQAAVLAGKNPLPGTDPLATTGLRNVDGTNNNILHTTFPDQYAQTLPTDTFGATNQPFIHLTPAVFRTAPASNLPAVQGFGSSYAQGANVADASPRVISNLIVDSTSANPATALAADVIGNPADVPLFVTPFSSLFTIFGQFFDHGLDFINKGGSGTVAIQLFPGDPLYVDPNSPNFIPGVSNLMFESRASVSPNN